MANFTQAEKDFLDSLMTGFEDVEEEEDEED